MWSSAFISPLPEHACKATGAAIFACMVSVVIYPVPIAIFPHSTCPPQKAPCHISVGMPHPENRPNMTSSTTILPINANMESNRNILAFLLQTAFLLILYHSFFKVYTNRAKNSRLLPIACTYTALAEKLWEVNHQKKQNANKLHPE